MKLLVATDGSDHAKAAAEYARSLIRQTDEVVLFAAGEESSTKFDEELPQFKAVCDTVSTHAEPSADARGKICDYAKDNAIDLIVCGSRGNGALKRAFVGSVSDGVVHGVDKSAVLVVHGKQLKGVRSFLVAVDGSDPSTRAVAFLANLLKADDQVVLYAAFQPPSIMLPISEDLAVGDHVMKNPKYDEEFEELSKATTAIVEKAKQQLLAAKVLPEDHIVTHVETTSDPRDGAIDFADAHNIQTLVCGTRGHGAVTRFMIGSFSTYIVHHANNHAVLVVH